MKEYWRTHEFPEERRRLISEKKKAYWSDGEASAEHREMLRQRMKEVIDDCRAVMHVLGDLRGNQPGDGRGQK